MSETEKYKIYYYKNSKGKKPVREYIYRFAKKERAKIFKWIEFLGEHKGCSDEPYSRHIKGKIRELRIGFHSHHHRIFYFAFVGKKIILLHVFLKKTAKTPKREIEKAILNYKDYIKRNK